MTVKKKVQEKIDDAKRIEFAKQIELFYAANNVDLKQVAKIGFVKGVTTGIGVFIGGTIVVTLLLWILSGLSQLPFIGELSEAAEQSIQEAPPN